jgi:ankyrin repeat protein
MPSNDKRKEKHSSAEVATGDFDDMLVEFAASDLKNAAKCESTTTATTASTASRAPKSTEEYIIEACAAGNLVQSRRWGRQGIRVASAGPLIQAAAFNKIDVMRCLVKELGADVNQVRDTGVMALTTAVYQRHLDAMVCLVKELGANVNRAGPDGRTPLLLAARLGYLELVSCLVKDLGADVNQKLGSRTLPPNEGLTAAALYHAASSGNLELVRLLVKELGAYVNIARLDGHTPLMAAAIFKHEKITKLLLKAGADA